MQVLMVGGTDKLAPDTNHKLNTGWSDSGGGMANTVDWTSAYTSTAGLWLICKLTRRAVRTGRGKVATLAVKVAMLDVKVVMLIAKVQYFWE